MENHIANSVAPTTRRAYNAALSSLNEFCVQHNIKDKYITSTLELFITSLAEKGMQASSIRTILSGIKHHCISNSIDINLNDPRLSLLMKGIQRSCGQKTGRPKNAVRMTHLQKILSATVQLFDAKIAVQVRAMFSLAFFAMLRPSELSYSSSTPQHQLKRSSVSIKSNCVKLTFSSFKHSTDIAIVKIQRQSPEVCPWFFLSDYLRSSPTANLNDPLFPSSTADANNWLQRCLSHCGIKSKLTLHSFRRGGATWYSDQGVTAAKLKAMGRWNSNAYLNYVKP